jgi:hypothetical protein
VCVCACVCVSVSVCVCVCVCVCVRVCVGTQASRRVVTLWAQRWIHTQGGGQASA